MKLRWTEKASSDALAIHRYISECSETYADAVYAKILQRPNPLIIDHPFLIVASR